MTPVMLMLALRDYLQQQLEDGAATKPNVYLGAAPSKTEGNRDDELFPLIIIRPVEGSSAGAENLVQVKLTFGTQSADDAGFVDCLNLMERVRTLLLRERIIERKYKIDEDWKWKFLEDQPYPYWLCQAITTWHLPQIRQEVRL